MLKKIESLISLRNYLSNQISNMTVPRDHLRLIHVKIKEIDEIIWEQLLYTNLKEEVNKSLSVTSNDIVVSGLVAYEPAPVTTFPLATYDNTIPQPSDPQPSDPQPSAKERKGNASKSKSTNKK